MIVKRTTLIISYHETDPALPMSPVYINKYLYTKTKALLLQYIGGKKFKNTTIPYNIYLLKVHLFLFKGMKIQTLFWLRFDDSIVK